METEKNARQSNATKIPFTGNAIIAAIDIFSKELEKVSAEKKALEERLYWAGEMERFHKKITDERNAAYLKNATLREENTTLKAELEAAKREADYLRTILSAVQIEIVK
jgi:hypothetical protein